MHSLKVVFISFNNWACFSVMKQDTHELFLLLQCDCNYGDEKLQSVNFKSGLYCTRLNIVFKPP